MQPSTRRAFLLALVASVALHALVVPPLAERLFFLEAPAPSLTAELQQVEPPPPPPPPSPPPRKDPPPAAKPKAAPRKIASAPDPVPRPAARIAVPTDDPAPALGTGRSDAPPSVDRIPTADPVPVVPERPPAPDVASAPAPAPAQDPFPARGTITYELQYGGGPIGRSEQRWRIEGKTYRLSSLSETTGLLSVFLPYQFAYVSEGSIGPDGYRPRKFSARRGRAGTRQATAEFDWSKDEIVVGPLGATRTLALPAGTQDLLSFIFQLGREQLVPGQRVMVITAGHKLETYTLDIGTEEAIELPIGGVRTVPIRQLSAPGEEHMELWLAADPPRVPVRIRFFDRGGNLTVEQIATRIETHGT